MKVYGRGPLDLTRKLSNLEEAVEGYKVLVEEQKKQIWELKKVVFENEKNKNLLQGYKKVIEDLSFRLRK
jgi:hypothetical protein|tara:strand:- start:306 stop:515 length:210 start_codon:yes stop_codon:yes gene_type:complete